MNTTTSPRVCGLLFLGVVLVSSATCKKNETSCLSTQATYSFITTSEWSPQAQVINRGDTLALISKLSKILQDQVNPSLTVDYSNSTGIGGNITVFKFDTILNQLVDAVSSFDFFSRVGTHNNSIDKPNRIINVVYAETSTQYILDLGVRAKERGIYAFYISNLASRGIRDKNCTKAGFSNTLTNTNKNINLFEYAMNRPPASQFEIDRIYCFRVQ